MINSKRFNQTTINTCSKCVNNCYDSLSLKSECRTCLKDRKGQYTNFIIKADLLTLKPVKHEILHVYNSPSLKGVKHE